MRPILPFIAFAILSAQAPPQVVYINVGQVIDDVVRVNPPGTTFQLGAGVFRMQQVNPLSGDVFLGAAGNATVLNGSRQLGAFTAAGALWYLDGQTQLTNLPGNGDCLSSFPLCSNPADLYVDNVPLGRVPTQAALAAGKWWFDPVTSRIYVAANPAGHVVELSTTVSAFRGNATGVIIRGLIVEKYASPAQFGAIGDQNPGDGWTVDNCEARLNHGVGVRVMSGMVLNSFVHHNGQIGITAGGTATVIIGNEIASNNYAGYNPGWEAGGTKFWMTTNLMVRGNYSHDNQGPGLWTDTDNINSTYDRNILVNNLVAGIQHEISQDAVISNNYFYGNGGPANWLWEAAILIQNSSNVQVFGNTIRTASNRGNGIGIINQNRGSGPRGPYVAQGNSIHDNDITYGPGSAAGSGLESDTTPELPLAAGTYASNKWHVADVSLPVFKVNQAFHTFIDWQAIGQDAGGTMDSLIPLLVIPVFARPSAPVPPPQISITLLNKLQADQRAAVLAINDLAVDIRSIKPPQ